eukprot:CAMPEP_0194275260 /NCGR_PEP_ID=MMETSP0169-20130528/8146_1 /TAXON_ID=218684 /ORGANISM="Corethron pennatum, Strain L29A3" /LENGTH=225 /DNA_ID=CAMNT_0039018681 /DNA_START=49 /DNA_END=726 /DNA_ORIENTATION=-
MFLPDSLKNDSESKPEEKRRILERVEQWTRSFIPATIRDHPEIQIHVKEQICGDPDCAPIDTVICILFPQNGRMMLRIQKGPGDVTEEEVSEALPPHDSKFDYDPETIEAGKRVWDDCMSGEEGYWPPFPEYEEEEEENEEEEDFGDPDALNRPPLRFIIGEAVQCRMGPDPVTGWAGGKVLRLWYRERNWPPGQLAPYHILLDDGREIFAPADVEQVIRKNPAN